MQKMMRELEESLRIFVNDNKTGCRFLTVDAYADVIPFYTKNDFVALDDNDTDARTRLLYFDLNDIADID